MAPLSAVVRHAQLSGKARPRRPDRDEVETKDSHWRKRSDYFVDISTSKRTAIDLSLRAHFWWPGAVARVSLDDSHAMRCSMIQVQCQSLAAKMLDSKHIRMMTLPYWASYQLKLTIALLSSMSSIFSAATSRSRFSSCSLSLSDAKPKFLGALNFLRLACVFLECHAEFAYGNIRKHGDCEEVPSTTKVRSDICSFALFFVGQGCFGGFGGSDFILWLLANNLKKQIYGQVYLLHCHVNNYNSVIYTVTPCAANLYVIAAEISPLLAHLNFQLIVFLVLFNDLKSGNVRSCKQMHESGKTTCKISK